MSICKVIYMYIYVYISVFTNHTVMPNYVHAYVLISLNIFIHNLIDCSCKIKYSFIVN